MESKQLQKPKKEKKAPKEVKEEIAPKEVKEKKLPVKKPKRKKNKKKSAHYVPAKDFVKAIDEFYAKPGEAEIGEQLGTYIYKIATGLSFAPNFINYSYKDDMVGDAIVKMISALKNKKFNPETGNNPFSYFTTIAFHAFINRIKKEKKQREIVTNYQESVYEDLIAEGQFHPSTAGTDSSNENTDG